MATLQAKTAVTDVKVVGLRRKVAEKMAIASSRIPHITYVEEIDVTGLEELRTTLKKYKRQDEPRLTLSPSDARDGASDRGTAQPMRH